MIAVEGHQKCRHCVLKRHHDGSRIIHAATVKNFLGCLEGSLGVSFCLGHGLSPASGCR